MSCGLPVRDARRRGGRIVHRDVDTARMGRPVVLLAWRVGDADERRGGETELRAPPLVALAQSVETIPTTARGTR